MQRYQFICDQGGCGVCQVQLREFETYRSEDLVGNLIERKTVPELVSVCCGGPVSVWDVIEDEQAAEIKLEESR